MIFLDKSNFTNGYKANSHVRRCPCFTVGAVYSIGNRANSRWNNLVSDIFYLLLLSRNIIFIYIYTNKVEERKWTRRRALHSCNFLKRNWWRWKMRNHFRIVITTCIWFTMVKMAMAKAKQQIKTKKKTKWKQCETLLRPNT